MSQVDDDLKDELLHGDQQKSDLSATSELLLNEKWKRRKTILRDRSLARLTTLDTIAEMYDVEWLRNWIDGYIEYATSVDGRGRQDIVDITKFSIDRETSMRKELLEHLGRR